MAFGRVKAVSHAAGRLMKDPQLSDNLFSVGLSVNHVDSISWDLTVRGSASSFISHITYILRKREIAKYGKEIQRGVSNDCPFNSMAPSL